jgi:hypothetical protein
MPPPERYDPTYGWLHQLAGEVAKHLDGFDPAPDDYPHRAVLAHPDGRGILLHPPDHRAASRGRVSITGHYPHHPDGDRRTNRPEITVRVDRGAEAIAGDITNRLLGPYQAALAATRELIARDETDRLARDRVAQRIAARLPGATIRAYDQHRVAVHWYDDGTGRGQAVVSHNGTRVDWEFDSDPLTAVDRVTAAIAGRDPRPLERPRQPLQAIPAPVPPPSDQATGELAG